MFNRARNIVISGGQLTSIANHNAKGGFQLLQEHVGTSAFHNSAQRVDPPRCHESTRKEVLQEIFDWIVQDATLRTTWIAWLCGAAGAGKTAIGQSIAELCIAHGILVASFFFFQTDPSRNALGPLIPTLAYQIVLMVPEIKDIIVEAIDRNPLIFKQSFSTQLDELIVKPLRTLQLAGTCIELVFIIDGIDECAGEENQREVVYTIARLLSKQDCPIAVLFSSRADNRMKSMFRSPQVSKILLKLQLDDHYRPAEDIRRFLDAKFTEIKETHSLSELLEDTWPPEDIVQEIVDKSSGQFIYASVVMKFVCFPCSHPAHQLDIIRGLRSSRQSSPFTHLDALYRHIFSKVQDLLTTTDILAYIILGNGRITWNVAYFFDLDEANVFVALSELTSVIVCEYGRIRFLHASLPDFLLDPTRSQDYYIDVKAYSTRLSIMWLDNAAYRRFIVNTTDYTICDFLQKAEATPELRESIVEFDPYSCPKSLVSFASAYLSALKNLDFNDGGDVYHSQLERIARYFRQYHPRSKAVALLEGHNVCLIMDDIDREENQKHTKHPPKRKHSALVHPSPGSSQSESGAQSVTPPVKKATISTNSRRSRRLMHKVPIPP